MSDELAEEAAVEFRPGWPDLYPCGLIVARSTVAQLPVGDDAEVPDTDEVRWAIHMGVREPRPRLALLGELTVRNPFAFAGVTVVMPFELRDKPDELTDEYADGILQQYGHWASSMLYDHAATALRSALAGNGLPLTVPYGTPPAELHLAADKAETED